MTAVNAPARRGGVLRADADASVDIMGPLTTEAAVAKNSMLVNVDTTPISNELVELDRRLAAVEKIVNSAMIRAGKGSPLAAPRRRPRNDLTLVDALIKAIKGKTLGVSEIVDAVQKEGYRTTSPNFRTIVNQTLINNPAFKRVSRGKYAVKAGK